MSVTSVSSTRVNYKIYNVAALSNLVAYVGSDDKFDLNSDGKLDINVKVFNIESGRARIQLMAIADVVDPIINDTDPVVNPPIVVPGQITSFNMLILVIPLAIALLIVIILIIYFLVREPKYQSTSPGDNPWANSH